MLNGAFDTNGISIILVFLEGILSFFSPCVIPLIPVYMSYLAGNAKKVQEDGSVSFERKKVFFHTVCFVLGVSFAFFILGMSFTALGNFFKGNRYLFTKIGGIIIILLGLFQLGLFDIGFLQKERKIHLNLADKEMNPMIAFIMGFTFSFAWTPCIGPALSSVLILASGAKSAALGNVLVLVYALGFVIPFLFLGLFTTSVLAFLKSRQRLLKITIKAGGIILLLIGIMVFTGWMNGISSYINSVGSVFTKDSQESVENTTEDSADSKSNSNSQSPSRESKEESRKVVPSADFTLEDQYGNLHTLSDYKGKVVFLNFWATWCGPCQDEMPHIEELYKEYNLNKDEVVILGVANPKSKKYPNNQDEEKEDIIQFLEDKEYTFPTVFDETGEVFNQYGSAPFLQLL
jgi:cytochrome c-type biogenesis protein